MFEVTDHGRVREIKLNHPPVNAMNPAFVSGLTETLKQAAASSDAVVVSGRPGMFSAGLDIPHLLNLDEAGMKAFWSGFLGLLHTLAHMPVPTAFALTGHAPAGGIVISLFGDYRVMAAGNYKTGLNEVQVGLVVSPVIAKALVRLIGPHPAEKILVPGSLLSPEQALEIGLVDELAKDPEATVAKALKWCDHLLSLPNNAMSITRRMMREDLCEEFDDSNDIASEEFVELWYSKTTRSTLEALVDRLKNK